jgi:hypothetical protein
MTGDALASEPLAMVRMHTATRTQGRERIVSRRIGYGGGDAVGRLIVDVWWIYTAGIKQQKKNKKKED